MSTPEQKLFLAQLLDTMREAVLASGSATATELAAVRSAVVVAAQDPVSTFYQARIHQVSGRRAGQETANNGR